ncbi:MAG: hypothetical protein A3H42_04510 [Deltaproteobacteria bacterium RIFCSPLOWO2_02_FULL_46_8]|nr:MAG: hypothetical protein A3H42_04510 [Deltaproteobacteria bacterium RIFCSPLOWO2_02_FULL_46_8]
MARQLFEYHPLIGYRFIPGLKARILHEAGGYFVRVNQTGFRSDCEFIPEKKNGKKRILLFGDSYTAGEGVANEQRYSDLLEKLIPNLEVYNFGLPGTGTDQQFLAYQEYAKNIEHDFLMIAILVENIRRNTAHYRIYQNEEGQEVCYAKPYYEMTDGKPILKNVPPSRQAIQESDIPREEKNFVERGGRFPLLRDVIKKMGLKDMAQKITHYQPFPEYDQKDSPPWQLTKGILREWITNHPKPCLLMPIPFYSHIEENSDPTNMQKRFQELAGELSCGLLDPLDALKKYPMSERRQFRFKQDIHLTPLGHAALAKTLVPFISKLL